MESFDEKTKYYEKIKKLIEKNDVFEIIDHLKRNSGFETKLGITSCSVEISNTIKFRETIIPLTEYQRSSLFSMALVKLEKQKEDLKKIDLGDLLNK